MNYPEVAPYAGSAVCGSAGNSINAAEPRLVALLDRLQTVCKYQGDHYARLTNLSVRLMGEVPRGVEGSSKDGSIPTTPPLLARIESMVAQLSRQNALIAEEVARLESLA